jgi:outer membrane protein assembly factor BamB
MKRCLCPVLALLGCAGLALAGNWPAWRGPDGDGHSPETDLPLKWSRTDNVRWKAELPDEGNSTPVVWGDRVFVTQATDKTVWPPPGGGGPATAEHRNLLCFRRSDGKLLWQREVVYKDKESTHPTNPFCSASPVTDGERVIVSHGSAGMYCYDFGGKELWHKDVGKLEHIWGNASSPVLYGDLAILWCGPGERQILLAVKKADGTTAWEYEEPGGKSGRGGSADWLGSWCTPLAVKAGDHDELVLGVPGKVKGFDPKTGKELWSCAGLGKLVYTSPVCSKDGVVICMGGYGGAALAVKVGGKGDVTQTHRLWHHTQQNPQRIGSGVIVGEHLYILDEPGLVQCLEVKTGKDLWDKQRLTSQTWGSMVAAGDRLYVTSVAGKTFVLAAKPDKMDVLAENDLGEKVRSSLAVSDGDLFIRTFKHLWCIGTKK